MSQFPVRCRFLFYNKFLAYERKCDIRNISSHIQGTYSASLQVRKVLICWSIAKQFAAKNIVSRGPFTRYAKLRFVHAPGMPGMPGTFSPPPQVSDPVVPWCMPGSLTISFLWGRWWGKRSRHKRPMDYIAVYGGKDTHGAHFSLDNSHSAPHISNDNRYTSHMPLHHKAWYGYTRTNPRIIQKAKCRPLPTSSNRTLFVLWLLRDMYVICIFHVTL